MKYEDDITCKNFPGKEFPERGTVNGAGHETKNPAEVTYEEGIYVGYRYYNTFNVKPAYEFGYGLSYTTFSYSPVQLSSADFSKPVTVTVTITNTGKTPVKKWPSYISAPSDKLEKPAQELKADLPRRVCCSRVSQKNYIYYFAGSAGFISHRSFSMGG